MEEYQTTSGASQTHRNPASTGLKKGRYLVAKKIIFSTIFFLLIGSLAMAQNAPQKKAHSVEPPGTADLVASLAQRLSHDLNVKTVIGEPIKVGSVTLIPILMIDVKFGSAATKAATETTAPQSAKSQANLFCMSGEARPLGFVAITQKGIRVINLVKSNVK